MSTASVSSGSNSSDVGSTSPPVTPPRIRKIFNRGNSLSILPPLRESPLEGLFFGDRGVIRDAEKTYSIATKRQPTVFLEVPMDIFVERCITIPVVTFKAWDKKVVEALLARAVKTDFSDAAIESVVNDMFHQCLNYSSILERIGFACELLTGSTKYVFLSEFIQDGRPVIFWDKYEKLKLKSPNEFNLLYEVMGRQEAFTILRKAAELKGEKIKQHFRSQIAAVALLEKKKRALFSCSVSFPNASDSSLLRFASVPPFAQNYQEFAETFRSFLSDGPFPKNTLRFNGEPLVIPDYKCLNSEDRELHFVKWLISEFQQRMHIVLAPEPLAQIQSFQTTPKLVPKVEKKLRSQIEKSLKKEFEGDLSSIDFNKKMESFFANFQKETADFSHQLRPFTTFLSAYLINCSDFKKRNWKDLSGTLITWYGRLYQLKEKHVSIPSLALLLSMGFPSYAICGQFLHFIGRSNGTSNSYQLIMNRDQIGSFNIQFKENCFETTHIKWYNVVHNKTVKAKVCFHWEVSGKLASFDYSYRLDSHDVQFSADCSEDERLMILDHLPLAIENIIPKMIQEPILGCVKAPAVRMSQTGPYYPT